MRELAKQDMALASGGVAPLVVLGAWMAAGAVVGWTVQAYLTN